MKIRFTVLAGLLAVSAFAADVTGKWSAEIAGRGGQTHTSTITLKQDGATVTGTVSGMRGETEISNGKVDGDTVTFTVVREFQGHTMKTNYTGTVSGDQIQFKAEPDGGQGRTMEFTAKRASTT